MFFMAKPDETGRSPAGADRGTIVAVRRQVPRKGTIGQWTKINELLIILPCDTCTCTNLDVIVNCPESHPFYTTQAPTCRQGLEYARWFHIIN